MPHLAKRGARVRPLAGATTGRGWETVEWHHATPRHPAPWHTAIRADRVTMTTAPTEDRGWGLLSEVPGALNDPNVSVDATGWDFLLPAELPLPLPERA